MSGNLYLGCAGWAIAGRHAEHFPGEGTHLARYAQRFSAVEINSSFYRPHKHETYTRWADSTPPEFRFAVKMPKLITHDGQLVNFDAALDAFLGQVGFLREKLGPILVQLPRSFECDLQKVERFFIALRQRFSGEIVCEPRHETCFTPEAEALMVAHRIARVVADPAPHALAKTPGGWRGLTYLRLHGSPKMYYSSYDETFLDQLVVNLSEHLKAGDVWCIFDNTALGAATENAITVLSKLVERSTQ